MMSSIFFFNDTATTEIYTLSLHDALPIWQYASITDSLTWGTFDEAVRRADEHGLGVGFVFSSGDPFVGVDLEDRKSTRLNSSHANISYAVFCLKKKKNFCYLYISSTILTT